MNFSANSLYAAESEKNTVNAGGISCSDLKAAIGSNDCNLQLIGHSHGAKVATVATQQLDQSGTFVKQLSLFDSPDNNITPSVAANGSTAIRAPSLIGSGPDKTFVDNYFTTFGRKYGSNVVNVALYGPDDAIANHGYPKSVVHKVGNRFQSRTRRS